MKRFTCWEKGFFKKRFYWGKGLLGKCFAGERIYLGLGLRGIGLLGKRFTWEKVYIRKGLPRKRNRFTWEIVYLGKRVYFGKCLLEGKGLQ